MTVSSPSDLRNIALVGHQGSGKTSLAEALLHAAGVIGRPGTVPDGTTRSDYHPSEKDREMSIFTTLLHANWHGHKINILDTPGYPDFSSEVIAAMQVIDTAVYVMDARSGVEVGTELAWSYGEQMNTPSMFVVNHVDHADANVQAILDEIEDRFGRGATAVQFPCGAGSRSIVDVLRMEQLHYPDGEIEPEAGPIDDAFREQADALHDTLVEDIAANDEALMEAYFEQGDLTPTQMREGLRAAMLERALYPVFVTSATEGIGTARLLDFVEAVCPSPAHRPVATEAGSTLAPDPDGDPVGFVYRTMAQEHVGEYSYVRLYNGTLESGQDLENARTGASERIGQIYVLSGADREHVPRLVAGDLGALVKLDDTNTNDTLRAPGSDVVIPPIQFPKPRFTMAVETAEDGKEDKLAQGLHRITAEDPSLAYDHDPILNQLTLSGQGELHLRIAQARLRRRAGVEVRFSEPKVSYREAIQGRATADYRHKKQSGGAGEFADLSLLVEPLDGAFEPPDFVTVRGEETVTTDWDAEVHFVNAIKGGVIDMNKFFSSIQKGVVDAMAEGPLAGVPVGDVRVVVYDGGMHPVDSNEAAFKRAAYACFRQAFEDARPTLLEPFRTVTVTTPDDYTGDVISDLNTRRGRIQGIDTQGPLQRITAEVPDAELHKYSTALRSITHGRGLHMTQFSHYEPVPAHVQDDIVEETAPEAA